MADAKKKITATHPPRPGSVHAFLLEYEREHPGLSVGTLVTAAIAAGHAECKRSTVTYTRYYYGVVAARAAAARTDAELKPPASAPKPMPLVDVEVDSDEPELVATVLRHGTAATRRVVDALETRAARIQVA